MNKIFNIIIILSICLLLFFKPEVIMDSFMSASEKSVQLIIVLLAVFSVWLGLLEIVKASGLDKKLAKLLSPIIKFLFGKQTDSTKSDISLNLSSNMLGLGNASTPSGISAMKKLDPKTGKITRPMIMLMIINTTAIQLLPTTVIGLRISYGSTQASSIILPTLIATTLSTACGIFLTIFIDRLIKKVKGKNK
jgi:spore maturation protein A